MSDYTDRIKTTNSDLAIYIYDLSAMKYLFIERRIDLIEAEVRKKLSGIAFQEIDTRVAE